MRLVIIGIGGAMGKVLFDCAMREGIDVACGVDKFARQDAFCVPVYPSCDKITEKADCIIDFSVREAVFDYIPYAVKNKIPCVVATTGYTEDELKFICDASKKIPIFKSGNMSMGINLLLRLAKIGASVLGKNADVEIIEQHHNNKIDSPSGTALLLADGIRDTIDKCSPYVYGRNKQSGKRKAGEIGIHSVRGGTVVGKHEILFLLKNEIITLKHEAESKSVLALGSLSAARFLINQKVGLYDMGDLLES